MLLKDEPGRYYQSRIVWLRNQRKIGICCYACDRKCSVIYHNGDSIFWDKNLRALSPQLPYPIVSWYCYRKISLKEALRQIFNKLVKINFRRI